MVVKTITIKKKGGGTRKQKVKVLASGKYKFVKNSTKTQSKYTKKVKKTTIKRRVKRTAKKRRRGKRAFTIPLAPVAGLAAGLVWPAKLAMDGKYEEALNHISMNYTGYDSWSGTWNPNHLMKGLTPLIIGGLVHKFVGGAPLNMNKMLANANVPVIRI